MRTDERGAPAQPPAGAVKKRSRRWLVVACVVLLSGLALSVAGALGWRASEQRHERQAFALTASSVSETLETLLRRDADFVATVGSVLTMQPNLSETTFNEWYATLQGKTRQVGSLGTAVVESVPAAQLAGFQARRNADAEFGRLVGGVRIAPVRPTHEARYCLISAGGAIVPVSAADGRLIQGDWCHPTSPIGVAQGALLQAASDTGQSVVLPVAVAGVPTILQEAAFYRKGAPVSTVAQRRAATAGWLVSTFDMTTVINTAIGSNRGLAATLYHSNPGQPLVQVGEAGAVVTDNVLTRTTPLPVDGGWSVTLRGRAIAGGLSANTQGALTFAGGAIMSVLLFLLVLILSRSRETAVAMVAEKTGELRHQALHDALTGLPNRVLTIDRAEQMLARARRAQAPMAALYVDIDAFKEVNDKFGHAAGDDFLRVVAERLKSVIRESDTAARLAGDEFVVLLDGSNIDAGPRIIAERVLEVLHKPYDLGLDDGRQLWATASVGLAYGLEGTAEELLADADLALYAAKAAGKNRYTVFESEMQAASQDRLRLDLDLGRALELDQLTMMYKPTFDLERGRAVGAEALSRWRHPIRGDVPPELFSRVAEETGLIVPIGRWVLEQACRQATRWHEQGLVAAMFVNLSARQLEDEGLIEAVRGALAASGLEPSTLTLEIAESTLMVDPDKSAETLTALRDLGVQIAIDDFGTGYSSLAYLGQFPVDALKIDRTLIERIALSVHSAALINTLIRLGTTLELDTLGEGIEDRAELPAAQRHSCDHDQGFLFARSLSEEQMVRFLAAAGAAAVAPM